MSSGKQLLPNSSPAFPLMDSVCDRGRDIIVSTAIRVNGLQREGTLKSSLTV